MTPLIRSLSVLWMVRIVANVVSYVRLWRIKEYRIDRMMIHLGTTQGRQILFIPWKTPPLTPKTFGVTVASIALLGIVYVALPVHPLVKLAVLDVVSFGVTALFVILTSVPTFLYHEILIRKAVRILRRHTPMRVIGITGSFGKTSTKEFLSCILSKQFRVVATEASKNSPIGIAEVVLRQMTPETQVFIVEMGAYTIGEIARMTDMVRPDIGIVTGINPQHQDLFGSMERTKRAKYELLHGLRGKRIAIVAVDNKHTRELAAWSTKEGCDVWSYAVAKTVSGKVAFRARDITQKGGTVKFTLSWNGRSQKVTVPIIGEHFAGNITAAIAAAVAAGMDFADACQAASTIKPLPKTMTPMVMEGGALLIDDTCNNNPDAAKAAIRYLATMKGKKILVFQPMIELGSFAPASHREVGELAARVCDDIILTNANWYEHFAEGVARFDANKRAYVLSPQETARFVTMTARKGDTILFKGKEAEAALMLLRRL